MSRTISANANSKVYFYNCSSVVCHWIQQACSWANEQTRQAPLVSRPSSLVHPLFLRHRAPLVAAQQCYAKNYGKETINKTVYIAAEPVTPKFDALV
jgi:hypothetical protein